MHAKSQINNIFLVLAVCASAIFFVMPGNAYAAPCAGNASLDETDPLCSVSTATTEETINDETLSNNGIFGCIGQGARVANVGTTRAVGGVYVPVNDAAVTLNTGFLVYKECILDGMARKIAESGTAELGSQAYKAFVQGREVEGRSGNTQFLDNYGNAARPYLDRILVNDVQALQSGQMCGAFRSRVATALARTQYNATRNSAASSACRFSNDADRVAMINGQAIVNWGSFGDLVSDNEITRYYDALAQNDARRASFNEDFRQMVLAGQGVIPRFNNTTNPLTMNVVTPGFLIANTIAQITGSGYRQLENANEIDQVVGNLWGGLSNRLVTSSSGVSGLFTSNNNQASYIDRMVAEARAAVRAGAVNAAVLVLSGHRQSESAYLEAKQGIANRLIAAITNIRGYESQCWDLIIPVVQAAATEQNITLHIATSTQFSKPVIDENIRDLASTTAADVDKSQAALTKINQLIASVTNSASSAAQQDAIIKVEEMVTRNEVHSEQEAQNAATQRDSISSALTTLEANTKAAWAESTDPTIGWCNIAEGNPGRQGVIDRWLNAWR